MPLPAIRFQEIRSFEGSQHAGFEELCCQLAALEIGDGRIEFVRKGRGGDAGVECFIKRASGSERGWQAKFVAQWNVSLEGQLNDSIRTALDKHPKLTDYVVCVPFDLPDARTTRAKSAAQKWEAWRKKWIAAAKAEGRMLAIELWGASQIGERLSRDDPAYSGRLLYWFDRDVLSNAWFREQFEKTRISLGSRYVPESNVELPIRKAYLAFVRDPALWTIAEEWSNELLQAGSRAASSIRQALPTGDVETHSTELDRAVNTLAALLARQPGFPLDDKVPVEEWLSATEKASEALNRALDWSHTLPAVPHPHTSSSRADWARHALYELDNLIDRIAASLRSLTWRLVNINQVLLTGEAGSGKSHLLADVCDHQIERGAPALMLLGSVLTDGEPWHQILTELDLQNRQVKHFLGAMDAAAEAAGMRAIVCIDALNERHGIDIWPDRLAAFLKQVERFHRVVVCVSCRSTYVPFVIPDVLDETLLPRLVHQGFGGTSGRAARYYLAKRGIVRTGVPNPLPEFENPLFLKTCCDFLMADGKREIPRGLQGVTAIFHFYFDAVARSVERNMQLDPTAGIVKSAITALSAAYAAKGEGYLSVPEVRELFEVILPSGGQLRRSLLKQLESEGVLSIEPVRLDDGSVDEQVRFTFERMSDHEIAQNLLNRHIGSAGVRRAFTKGTPLFNVVAGDDAYRRAGVVEAIAVQLAERFQVELPDTLPKNSSRYVTDMAFQKSLLWRDQAFFTERTWKVAVKLLGPDEIDDLTINIATEPRNPYNAFKLHGILSKFEMPERDRRWSTRIAYGQLDDDSAIGNLIGWAFDQGLEEIEDDRAELATIALTWFLTTSSRVVRDRATKALACVLANRLTLASRLLDHFANVDDLYLQERLVAAIYGAALQGRSTPGLADLADKIYSKFLTHGAPPLNALLREHASGIVLYAAWRGVGPERFDPVTALAPYRSPWPIEHVSQEQIETYKQDYGRGMVRDDIVSSAGLGGDFGRYILPSVANRFSPAPIGSALLTSKELYNEWHVAFLNSASDDQVIAFSTLLAAAKICAKTSANRDSPERAQFREAEDAFRVTLSTGDWDDFEVRARAYVAYEAYNDGPRSRSIAEFDIGWASRWVIKRAHDLGWTPDRFGTWEGNMRGHGRNEHAVERVGKKYQWLALNELAARMGDNLAYKGGIYSSDEEPRLYRGAYDVSLRDIDPSLLVTATEFDGWKEWPKTWWVPAGPNLSPMTPQERLSWREGDSDIINDTSLIEVTNPKDGRRWLVLRSFGSWSQNEVVRGEKMRQRDTWFRLNCYVVRKKNAAKLMTSLRGRRLTDDSKMPKLELQGDHYLGEYPWHPYFDSFGDWVAPDTWTRLPVPILGTATSYSHSTGSYDYSVDETIHVQLPAPWIIDGLGLHCTGGRELTFVDAGGKLMFYDPSTYSQGNQAALIDREAFLDLLSRQSLEAIWVIAGEKSAYGGARSYSGWGGSKAHTNLYRIKNGFFTVEKFVATEEPSAAQLQEFFEG